MMMASAAAGGAVPVVACPDHHHQPQLQAAVGVVEPPAPASSSLHRRSAHYQPSSWDYDTICSPAVPQCQQAADDKEKKERVRRLLRRLQQEQLEPSTTSSSSSRLIIRVIHQLQSLGVAYHFEEEIRGILLAMHRHRAAAPAPTPSSNHGHGHGHLDLHSAALLFAMLRGHGIPAPTDMVMSAAAFRQDHGSDGLLALYQASHLAFPGETVLEEARTFAVDNLLPAAAGRHLLPPSHWTPPRLQAMWSLQQRREEEHGSRVVVDDDDDPAVIVQLAQADFNLVQAMHRAELAEVTRWWTESGLGEKLPFARDRVVECFFCAACIAPEPHLAECREVLAKTGSLIVHLDDVYDVHGTPDELQAFTDAIGSWPEPEDVVMATTLPEYMRAMYSAIWTTSVAAADRVLKKHGYDVLPLYKKQWHELCKAFLVEAQWQRQGYTPSFGEYVSNGWVTSTGPLLLLHALPAAAPTTEDGHRQLRALLPAAASGDGAAAMDYPRLVELSSTIFRLCNDCASHEAESERGDAPSSIACCMADEAWCASEEQARAAVQGVAAETWKVLNKEVVASAAGGWSMAMANLCLNLARTIHCIYQDGDGITSPTQRMKHMVEGLLFNPITL